MNDLSIVTYSWDFDNTLEGYTEVLSINGRHIYDKSVIHNTLSELALTYNSIDAIMKLPNEKRCGNAWSWIDSEDIPEGVVYE